ncbi:MAG: response regulator [Thiotrichaceae bacterium]
MSPKILIIEDNLDVRNLLRIYLMDYYAVTIADSDAALVAWEIQPDLILLTMQSATINGYEIIEELRIQHSTAPIIALLNAEKEAQEQALAAGCRVCLVKPKFKGYAVQIEFFCLFNELFFYPNLG